jgi:hypothetical protein
MWARSDLESHACMSTDSTSVPHRIGIRYRNSSTADKHHRAGDIGRPRTALLSLQAMARPDAGNALKDGVSACG